MTLLPARADVALGSSCHRCQARERCYRSPQTRAQAVGRQNWMETTPGPNGEPCVELWLDLATPNVESAILRILRAELADLERAVATGGGDVCRIRRSLVKDIVRRADAVALDLGEAIYITADQVDEHRAAGWTVEPALGHHGEAGFHVAVRKA